MAAINDADVSVDVSGNIRWTGAPATNQHSMLEFIQWLMLKQDDGQAAGDDLLDITVDTAFERSTDQILALNAPFNIDDTFATHLYDGSVSQIDPDNAGETLYAGLEVIGPVVSGTEYMVLQNGKVLPSYWGTGINPKAAPSAVFSRHLVKVKFAGAEIDGQNIVVLARELGDGYRRFPTTLGTGNSVAAISNGDDIFNNKSDATLAAMTSITNQEGQRLIDMDNDGTPEEYYSEWNTGTQTVNDTYEHSKFDSQRSHDADVTGGTPTGQDNIVNDNAGAGSIVGQCQSFIPRSITELITEVRVNVSKLGTAPGNIYCELYESDDVGGGASRPTGSALARSEAILESAITTSNVENIFRFNIINPATGVFQNTTLDMANAEYFIIFRATTDGDATNHFLVEGASTSQDAAQNSAVEDPAATFTASVNDIGITVKSSPVLHLIPGEQFQGINIEVGWDGPGGTEVAENNIVMWGTRITYDNLVSGPFLPGELIQFRVQATAVVRAGGTVLYDDGTDIIVALDTLSAVVDNDEFTTVRGNGATETTGIINVTIADNDKAGGNGVVLAKDDNGSSGEVYLQILSGSAPVDNSVIRRDDISGDPLADFITATAVLNAKTIVPEFIGASTGTNVIGAYGIGFEFADVGSSDRFTALDDSQNIPPNNVLFTVSGVVSGEDRVLVGPRTGSVLDKGQWLLNTALTGGSEVAVVVKTGTDTVPWPANEINWPATGQSSDPSSLRVELDSGIYRRVDYESHDSTDTFTILSTSFTGVNVAAANNDVFMGFIDVLADATSESFTGVHTAVDRDLFVRIRDGGGTPIKTFEANTAQFLSTPQTVAAVRTSDA